MQVLFVAYRCVLSNVPVLIRSVDAHRRQGTVSRTNKTGPKTPLLNTGCGILYAKYRKRKLHPERVFLFYYKHQNLMVHKRETRSSIRRLTDCRRPSFLDEWFTTIRSPFQIKLRLDRPRRLIFMVKSKWRRMTLISIGDSP